MTNDNPRISRRNLLKLTGTALTIGALAGCTDTKTNTDAPTETSTSTPPNTEIPNDDDQLDADTREKAQQIGKQTRESTVKVRAGNGGGAGWIYNTKQGLILTNSHVVRDINTVTITTFDGSTYTGTVIGNNPTHIPDVALIQITENDRTNFNHPALTIGNDQTLTHGDTLIQVGHPFRVGSWVVAVGEYLEHVPQAGWFESTLPTQSGNSGGPVVNLDGEVVGLTSGGTPSESASRPYKHEQNPPKLYTKYPEFETDTTHAPITDAMSLVESWTN